MVTLVMSWYPGCATYQVMMCPVSARENNFTFCHKMAESSRVGSYRCKFINEVSKYLVCKLCRHAANGPSMTTCCGELFCKACIAPAVEKKRPCPSCERSTTFSVFPNPRYERDIKNLCVCCTMKDRGCQWTGKLEQLDAHLDVETGDCEYVDIDCPEKCGQQIQKCRLDTHIANECPERDFVCQYCDFKATYDIVTNKHWPECQKYPVKCPNECDIGVVKRSILEDHLNTCPLQVIECNFSYAGCDKKLQRQDMEKHVEESTREHLALMAAASVRMSREFEQKLQDQRNEFRGYLEKKEEVTISQRVCVLMVSMKLVSYTCQKLASYKSAGNFPTKCFLGTNFERYCLYFEIFLQNAGKFPTDEY